MNKAPLQVPYPIVMSKNEVSIDFRKSRNVIYWGPLITFHTEINMPLILSLFEVLNEFGCESELMKLS
tara:strand:- start:102 stop:305 length:204 start_codon:yes stop_codon:yes gene_type:complete